MATVYNTLYSLLGIVGILDLWQDIKGSWNSRNHFLDFVINVSANPLLSLIDKAKKKGIVIRIKK